MVTRLVIRSLISVDSLSSFDSVPTPPHVHVIPLYKKPAFPGTIIPILVSDKQLANRLLNEGAQNECMFDTLLMAINSE
jgi:hypothetical protein